MDESYGSCVDQIQYDGEPFSSSNVFAAQDTVDIQPYGLWSGTAKFWTMLPSTQWVDNGSSTRTVNLGRSPQEECEANWGYWNEDTQQCENITDPGTPIILAVGQGQAYRLTSIADGVSFDLDNDGNLERVAWTDPSQELAFLAIDRDGDSRISNGAELLGDHTIPGVGNGFLALAQLMPQSSDGDQGAIEFTDPLYERLLLWTDRDHDGMSAPGELRKASELFTKIGLGFVTHRRRDGHGNLFRYRGWAELRTRQGPNKPESGSEHQARLVKVYDVFLGRVK